MGLRIIGGFAFSVLSLIGILEMQGIPNQDEQTLVAVEAAKDDKSDDALNIPTAKVMFLSKDIIRIASGDDAWYVNFNSASGKPIAERDIIVTSFVGGQQPPMTMKLSEAAKYFADKVKVGPDDWAKIERRLRN